MAKAKKPDVRGKLESECSTVEREMIREWYAGSHPSNYPANRETARWTFSQKYGATLFAGFL